MVLPKHRLFARDGDLMNGPGPSGTPRAPMGVDLKVLLIAIAAGLLAANAPARPTGHPLTDAVLNGMAVGLVVLVGASAPWWVVAGAGLVALVTSSHLVLAAAALVAIAVAVGAGRFKQAGPAVLAMSLAVTFNVLARSRLGVTFGMSAAIAIGTGLVVFLFGIARHSRRTRMVALVGATAVVVFAGAATAAFGWVAFTARHDLGNGKNAAELGVAALERGDFAEASKWFKESAENMESADRKLGSPLVTAASVVPIVAQHQHAVTEMSHVGATGARTVAEALDDIDPTTLQPVRGRIDLAAVTALRDPLTRVRAALGTLESSAREAYSPWLVNRATSALDDFTESVGEHLPALDNSLSAIDLAPRVLGAEGTKTYLLLFTSPSEARGLGGQVGGYAELSFTDGQMSVGAFGRAQDLDAAVAAAGARIRGNDELRALYGSFGLDTDGSGLVGDTAFRTLAMSPNYPAVASAAADLYAQATGRTVDGVVTMDPFVLGALLKYTGPIHLTTVDREVSMYDAAPFLLRDQYVLGDGDSNLRADALAEAAGLAFTGLVDNTLPEPIELSRDLGGFGRERRVLVWSADDEVEVLFERVGIAGTVPSPSGGDAWAFTVSNLGGSKIDSFLERRASYETIIDPTSGRTSGTMRIDLTNTAPTDGFPASVIGNRIGKPVGTSSLMVFLYSPLGLDDVTVDGTPVTVTPGTEAGYNTYCFAVDIASGATAHIEAKVSGTVDQPDAEVVTWTQPLATDLQPLD